MSTLEDARVTYGVSRFTGWRAPTLVRLLRRTEQVGDCWVWNGVASGLYGKMWAPEVGRNTQWVHRVAYHLLVGPIAAGLQVDHLCRNTLCVNPAHLDLVTQRENLLRGDTLPARCIGKTTCSKGHPYDATNTGRDRGARVCRQCARDKQRRLRERRAQMRGSGGISSSL